MNRRSFLVKVIKLSSLYFIIPNFSLAEKLFPIPDGEVFIPGKGYQKLRLMWIKKIPYISISELASILQTNTYTNATRKKIVLYYNEHRFTVTANNNFVIVDGEIVQMPFEAKEFDSELYVPAEWFLNIFRDTTKINVAIKKEEHEDTTNLKKKIIPEYTVKNFTIEYKEDGFLVNVQLDKPFKEEHISAEFRNEWLFLDLYHVKKLGEFIHQIPAKAPIKKLKVYSYPEMQSIGLKLVPKKWIKEEWLSPSDGLIKILIKDPNFNYEEVQKEESENSEKGENSWLLDTIVIDPGHGGKDPGAIGYRKIKEKDVVLKIGLKLKKLIQKELPDVKVILTRNKDVFIPLKERTQLANKRQGKLFISIHANSVKNKRVSGFETYILGVEKEGIAREIAMKENSVIEFEKADVRKEYEGYKLIIASLAQNAFMKQSSYFAEIVQQELAKELKSAGLKDRGVKQGPFWVLVGASMPNILVETGFISNKHDAKILKTGKYQLKIAKGILNGIKRYKQDIESVL